jgi:hypothetical protein
MAGDSVSVRQINEAQIKECQIKDCQVMLNKILHSSPENSDSLAVVRKIIRCDDCSSRQAAVCSVELRFFCMHHFVAYCYQRLEESERILSARQSGEPVRGFLRECATQAAKLLLLGEELQNIERARLFDIMLWSNELLHTLLTKSGASATNRFRPQIPGSSPHTPAQPQKVPHT